MGSGGPGIPKVVGVHPRGQEGVPVGQGRAAGQIPGGRGYIGYKKSAGKGGGRGGAPPGGGGGGERGDLARNSGMTLEW